MSTTREHISEHIDQAGTSSGPVSVGKRESLPERLTVLAAGLTFNGNVYSRYDIIELDSRAIGSTVDANGGSWLSDLSTEAQERRWGRQMLAVGDRSAELRAADREALEAKEAQRQRERDRSGMSLLEQIWREENEQAAQPLRSHSTTTSRSRTMT